MKAKKLCMNLLFASLFCVIAVSCDIFEADSRAYDGPSVAGFKFQERQVEAAAPDSAYTINLEVQLVRSEEGLLEKALPIHFVVVDSSTTATSPDDYEILTSSPVVIPAGQLITSLKIKVNGSNIPLGEARILVLQLTGNESRGVVGGDNIGRYMLTIANSE